VWWTYPSSGDASGYFYNMVNEDVYNEPEEVLSAVEFSVAWEAPFAETRLAVGTLYAADVPRAIQHVQQKPVDNGTFTPGTDHHHRYTASTRSVSLTAEPGTDRWSRCCVFLVPYYSAHTHTVQQKTTVSIANNVYIYFTYLLLNRIHEVQGRQKDRKRKWKRESSKYNHTIYRVGQKVLPLVHILHCTRGITFLAHPVEDRSTISSRVNQTGRVNDPPLSNTISCKWLHIN